MKSKKRRIAAAVCAAAMTVSCLGSVGAAAADELLGEIAAIEPQKSNSIQNWSNVNINVRFPDPFLAEYIQKNYDTDDSGYLDYWEMTNIRELNLSSSLKISSLQGIEYLEELKSLTVNCRVKSLDVSKNSNLKELNCSSGAITELDLSANTALEKLVLYYADIKSLDLSANTALKKLNLQSLDEMKSIDISNCASLEEFTCKRNSQLTSITANNNNLKKFVCSNNSQLEVININCPSLTDFVCTYNRITSIDLSNSPNISDYAWYDNTKNNSYKIGEVNSFSLDKLPGSFDPSKVSKWNGATYDAATNTLTNFTADRITYGYNCGNGKWIGFTLLRENKPASEEDISAFVERLYQNILNRPSDGNKTTHTDNLKNGESACKVAYDFIFSSEFAELPISNEDRVKRMYLTFLNREADPAGLADWTAVLDNGCSIGHIFQGFTQSNEFTEICAEYGITRGTWEPTENRDKSSKLTAFVSRLYTKAMGRAYDVNGLNDHTGSYLANHDLYQLAYNFIFSQEFLDKNLSNEEFVDVMYRTFFDREADPAGKEDWLNRMANGATREDVLAGFVGSQECIDLVARFGI